MSSEIIKVESVQGKVYEKLREQIINRQLVPGEKITIRQIAEAYGVSVMPVREALRQLQSEGLVTYDRRGVTIKLLSAHEVQQIMEIRNRLEALAAEWALPNLKKSNEQRFEEIVREMDSQMGDLNQWRMLNRQFHLEFYAMSGSRQLQQIIENLWVAIEPYMRLYTSTVATLEFAQRQHHEILEAIKKKDIEKLKKLISIHIGHTAKVILENF